jgi:large subunit ribosomal protein L21
LVCLSIAVQAESVSTEPDGVFSTMADTKTTTPAASEEAPSSAKEAAPAPAASEAYAIVEASGTQVWLQPNRYYDLDRLHAEVDDTIKLENVLLVKDAKGTTLGQPYVKEATVELKVMAHRRGPKLIVYKMRPKKKTRRKNGHRQELTRVMVESITVGGKAIS